MDGYVDIHLSFMDDILLNKIIFLPKFIFAWLLQGLKVLSLVE